MRVYLPVELRESLRTAKVTDEADNMVSIPIIINEYICMCHFKCRSIRICIAQCAKTRYRQSSQFTARLRKAETETTLALM